MRTVQEIKLAIRNLKGIMPGTQTDQLIRVGLKATGPRVEIGCLAGLSTCCLALSAPDGEKIISIDPFRIEYLSAMAKDVIRAVSGPEALTKDSFFDSWVQQTDSVCKGKNLVPIIGDRLEVLETVTNNIRGLGIGLLFLDGLHSYEAVKAELDAYLPFVYKNGYVVFHDYSETFGVKQAVDEAVANRKIIPESRSYVFIARKP